MADFEKALSKTMAFVGGYKLGFVDGVTYYAGISRFFFPGWVGWQYTDKGEAPPKAQVIAHYRFNVWRALWCNLMHSQRIAWSLFDFAVTAGNVAAVTALQKYLGLKPTGLMSCSTYEMLDCTDEQELLLALVLQRVECYAAYKTNSPAALHLIKRALAAL